MDAMIIVALVPVLISIYGVISRQRFYFLMGYFLYGILVFGAEFQKFMANDELSHLLVAGLWGLQAILAFPNKLNYDGTKVFKLFALKTFLSLFVINLIGIFVVKGDETVPSMAVYLHGILMVLPALGFYLMSTNKIPIKKN
jgi:hypothetical protein